MDLPRLLSVQEVADALGVSTSYLNKARLTLDGPPFVKLGARVAYDPADVTKWVELRKHRHTSEHQASRTAQCGSPADDRRKWLKARELRRLAYGESEGQLRPLDFLRKASGIYFIGSDDLIKIGWSADLHKRLQSYLVHTPRAVLHAIERAGDSEREGKLHTQFEAARSHGEWFYLRGAVREYIEGIEDWISGPLVPAATP